MATGLSLADCLAVQSAPDFKELVALTGLSFLAVPVLVVVRDPVMREDGFHGILVGGEPVGVVGLAPSLLLVDEPGRGLAVRHLEGRGSERKTYAQYPKVYRLSDVGV